MKEKKGIHRKFFFGSAVLAIILGVLFLFIGSGRSGENFLSGLFIGSISSWVATYAFFSLILWSYERTLMIFYLSLFGGMLAKVLLLLTIIFISVALFQINYLWLIASIMVYYLAFMILEIYILAKYFPDRRKV